MSAPPAEICPNCGAKALHRLISGGTGIIFKGHGFYCTDYKSGPESSSVEVPSSESDKSVESKKTKDKSLESQTKQSASKNNSESSGSSKAASGGKKTADKQK